MKAYKFTYIFLLVMIVTLVSFLILWCTKTYVVNFDTDGAQTYEAVLVRPAQKVKFPSSPVKEGYIFEGWYLNDKYFDEDTLVYEDITLKDKWKSVLEP